MGGDAGHTEQGFHCRTELVAEGAAGGVLNQAQLVWLDTQSGGDHVEVQEQADGLGMDRQASFFIVISKAHITLNGQVWLALQVEVVLHHKRRCFHDRPGVSTFDNLLLVVHVGCARMDFDGIFGHGGRSAHISGQLLAPL